jgi:hypothetical protein
MAIWDLAVAWDTGSQSFPKAIVNWIGVQGGQPGGVTQGYASFDEALGKLMKDGWEPFSAHRWEDFDAYGPNPVKKTGSLPIRDYVWFRRAVKGSAVTRRRPTVADATVKRAKPQG